MAQDSTRPQFWEVRYSGGVTPWDAGGVPAQLQLWLQSVQAPLRVLVPGCGAGHEVRAFAERGHEVLAIDFADAAIEAARRALGPLATRLRKADFFDFEASPFDLVYERAFLCALPRRLWPQWAARLAQVLRPGGELAGFFYLDDNDRGPPFGVAPQALRELLGARFELLEERAIPAAQSIPVFKGKELWQVWKRSL